MKDYNKSVQPSEERWLGLIKDKWQRCVYTCRQDMLLDVKGIKTCAENTIARPASPEPQVAFTGVSEPAQAGLCCAVPCAVRCAVLCCTVLHGCKILYKFINEHIAIMMAVR